MAEKITSKSNDKIKYAAKLTSSAKFRREENKFILEGLRLCFDAVINGIEPIVAMYTATAYEKNAAEIGKIAECAKEVYELSDDVFAKVSDTVNPQGIIIIAKWPSVPRTLKKDGKYVVLHNIANPDNAGAISRSVEAFGADGMIVSGGCDVYSPKALRASMGALLRLPVFVMSDNEMLAECEKYGIMTYASTPRVGAKRLDECDFSGGAAILIGNEANGLPDEVIAKCDNSVTIPMNGRAESLNAAAAAAVLIYEMMK